MKKKILSPASVKKLKGSVDHMINQTEEVIKDSLKEKNDEAIELNKEVERLKDVEQVYAVYREIYNDENAFICESIEDQRKLEALKRNWEYISFEDIDKLCKF